jgi:preprotein translocase subunit SecD
MMKIPPFKIIAVISAILITLGLLAPSLLPDATVKSLPTAWQEMKVVLGLDLRGGSHVLMEVEAGAVKKSLIDTLQGDVRKILRDNNLQHQGITITTNGVQFRLREGQDATKALVEVRKIVQPVTAVAAAGQPNLDVRRSDDGLFTISPTEAGLKEKLVQAIDRSIEVIRRRIDQLGATEPNIQRQGADRVLIQVPGLDDPKRLQDLLGKTAKLTFRMVDMSIPVEQALAGRAPADSEILYEGEGERRIPYLIQKREIVTGAELIQAEGLTDSNTREPIVSFRFNGVGGKKFADATRENVGRPFAIVLDDKVISAPVIREPILTGSGQISGRFTQEQVRDLAILLRAGALPAPLNIVEQRVVGASLGADSIKAGTQAALIGCGMVLIYILLTYGLFGMFANIAVIVNVMMIFAAMIFFRATLTLPGIAGIVLTVGIAVDSNVLIYERIREEYKLGRSVASAIDSGFKQAWGTIFDANATAFIVAVVLFTLGSGAVRGFALTFGIGIITTLITAVTFTQLLVSIWVKVAKPKILPI